MTSSPLLVMTALATVVTVGYLALNNRGLRQDGKEIVLIAERNLLSLNNSIDECIKKRDERAELAKKLEASVAQAITEKAGLEAAIREKEAAYKAAISPISAERDTLRGQVEEANKKIASLTQELVSRNIDTASVSAASTSSSVPSSPQRA